MLGGSAIPQLGLSSNASLDNIEHLYFNGAGGSLAPGPYAFVISGDPARTTNIGFSYRIVQPAAQTGDFNFDGKVDAADYVLWRKSPEAFGGDPGGFNAWRAHFGQTAGSGAALPSATSLSATVPEPATVVLIIIGVVLANRRRHRGKSQSLLICETLP